jgi:hypothetical protein
MQWSVNWIWIFIVYILFPYDTNDTINAVLTPTAKDLVIKRFPSLKGKQRRILCVKTFFMEYWIAEERKWTCWIHTNCHLRHLYCTHTWLCELYSHLIPGFGTWNLEPALMFRTWSKYVWKHGTRWNIMASYVT